MSTIPRLKKRSDFLRVAAFQRKVVMPTMIVQLAERSFVDKDGEQLPTLRMGFTVSKKVGNAVKRNYVRRRLRAVVDSVCPRFSFCGYDIVVIARPPASTSSFASLLRDFQQALKLLDIPLR